MKENENKKGTYVTVRFNQYEYDKILKVYDYIVRHSPGRIVSRSDVMRNAIFEYYDKLVKEGEIVE